MVRDVFAEVASQAEQAHRPPGCQADDQGGHLAARVVTKGGELPHRVDSVPVSVSEWLLGSFVLILRRAP